jgi:predicted nucleotidyltransferase
MKSWVNSMAEAKDPNIERLIQLAKADESVEVLWLYGSRARGSARQDSDYDLAVAFKTYIDDALEARLRPELLAMDWQKALNIDLSIVDINQASIPLAYTVVMDNCLLLSKNSLRHMTEEQKIMSKWELDHCYHKKHFGL